MRRLSTLVALLATAAVLAVPAQSSAAFQTRLTLTMPGTGLRLGDERAIVFTLRNNSTGPESADPLTVQTIALGLSCASVSIPCTQPDYGVFGVASVTPRAGSGCAGVTFTLNDPQLDPNNRLRPLPSAPITLDAGEECVIDFVVRVLRLPVDSSPTTPGLTTYQAADVDITHPLVPTWYHSTSRSARIDKALPSLSLQPPVTPVFTGSSISTGANLTGLGPTGTIDFQLFGPDDPTCAGTPFGTSSAAVDNPGTYQSATFTPTAPGAYRWVATYAGDAQNDPVATSCTDPNAEVVVADPSPDPVPTCLGKPATIVGTDAAEKLRGSPGADVIVGGAGRDVIRGLGGNDRLCGGAGRDSLVGGGGNDRLSGGAGRDACTGSPGRDRAGSCEQTKSL